jgi:hypothetical protein
MKGRWVDERCDFMVRKERRGEGEKVGRESLYRLRTRTFSVKNYLYTVQTLTREVEHDVALEN